jgi:hypothetical protein
MLSQVLKTAWVKTTISGMERETYLQEWTQSDAERVVGAAGFTIIKSRPFLRIGGRHPLLSILAHAKVAALLRHPWFRTRTGDCFIA